MGDNAVVRTRDAVPRRLHQSRAAGHASDYSPEKAMAIMQSSPASDSAADLERPGDAHKECAAKLHVQQIAKRLIGLSK